ncbi:acyltransferase family protein [Qipengyuania huizhouensis]|uniref:acyltransferase family protein n=1 Tax=Qipengyuania huizhouensis TaxID=2867245 RepID=UPI001C867F43|nr:acyltransferase [Qipengyuania huizhouensis]MBX7460384.1 acyltransferase [Qipengyuania huizhouensis]
MWTLDGLRGLAAISVVIYHGLYWYSDKLYSSVGKFAVYLFFVLSAMTLAKVYRNRFSSGVDAISLATFYRNRVARIIPLLLFVALLSFAFAVIGGNSPSVEGSKMLLTATGAFGLAAAGVLSNSVGAWSLGIEIAFYAVFPIIAVLTYNARLRTLVAAAIALNLLQFTHNYFVFAEYNEASYWPVYVMPLSFAAYFAWGVVLAMLPRKPMTFGWLGLPLIFLVVWISLLADFSTASLLAWPGALLTPLLLAGGTYLVFCWKTPDVLLPLFSFLGSISYSIYLLHPPVYFLLTRTFWPAGSGNAALFVALLTSISIVVAWCVHKVFEQPMRHLIRNHWVRVNLAVN